MLRRTITGEAPLARAHMVGPWHEVGTSWGTHSPCLGQGGGLSVGLSKRRIFGDIWAPTSRGKHFCCCLGESSSSTEGPRAVNGQPCIPH